MWSTWGTHIPNLWQRLFSGYRRVEVTSQFLESAPENWQEHIFEYQLTDRLFVKQGRSIVRWTVNEQSQTSLIVFLKRHFKNPKLNALKARLFPYRAWTPSFEEAENLKIASNLLGQRVPNLQAVLEEVIPQHGLRGCIALEELKGMLALHEAIPLAAKTLQQATFRKWKKGLIQELARLSFEMHRQKWFHQDWYLCHFYILETDCHHLPSSWHGNVVTIDFHRLRKRRVSSSYGIIKDIAQLNYSSRDVIGITESDRLYFWQEYNHLFNNQYRHLESWIIKKSARYWSHNQRAEQKKASQA